MQTTYMDVWPCQQTSIVQETKLGVEEFYWIIQQNNNYLQHEMGSSMNRFSIAVTADQHWNVQPWMNMQFANMGMDRISAKTKLCDTNFICLFVLVCFILHATLHETKISFSIALHVTLHYMLHCITCYIALHVMLHWITYYIALQVTLQYMLHCITRYITLHVTLHYMLQCITY